MKRNILSLSIIAVLSLTVACKDKIKEAETADAVIANESTPAVTYNVDTKESVIDWTGTKLGGKHIGTIHLSNGKIGVTEGVVSSGEFTIDINSIVVTDLTDKTGKADLENHLKGSIEGEEDHFFNVNKYPKGTFEITSVNTEEDMTTYVEGNLTLKDITKSIKFPATVTVSDNNVSIVSAPFAINRTLWNINYASKSVFSDLGDKFVNDDIELAINIKASK